MSCRGGREVAFQLTLGTSAVRIALPSSVAGDLDGARIVSWKAKCGSAWYRGGSDVNTSTKGWAVDADAVESGDSSAVWAVVGSGTPTLTVLALVE